MAKRMKTVPSQWTVLLDFIQVHPGLATKNIPGPFGKEKYDKLWNEVAIELNSMGLGCKTSEKWQEAFTKWKSKTKAKAQVLQKHVKGTGGGGPPPHLNENEQKLMAIVGWTAVNGDETQELGIIQDQSSSDLSVVNQQMTSATTQIRIETPPLSFFSSKTNNILNTTSDNLNSKPSNTAIPNTNTISSENICLLPNCKDQPSAANLVQPLRKINRKKKSTQGKENMNLVQMHQENMEMLTQINNNLKGLVDSQEQQVSILQQYLDYLKK